MALCPACGEDNPDRARFCLACGSALTGTGVARREERKVVTVLFCDLVGFTARSDQADPEDVQARLRPYHARLRKDIERFGGTVEKFIGDAVMAVFGAPIAHEDDTERAVRSALRITQSIAEMNDEQVGLDRAHTSRASGRRRSAMGHVFDVALTKLAAARCLAELERFSEAAERALLAGRTFDSVRAVSLSAEARSLVERAHAVGS